jgi:exonuclease III
MEIFRDALSDCDDLTDIGFYGVPYTYDNHRSGDANVRVHLDKAVADSNLQDLFAEVKVHHLVMPRSDHCPLLVELKKDCWEIKGP